MNKSSYISTTIPAIKVLCNNNIVSQIINHSIVPYHVKINPTNKCTLNCSMCTFKNRDKTLEIEYEKLITITDSLIRLGMRAITLSGGGDPLAYPYINEYIDYVSDKRIKVGLTTNGFLFSKVKNTTINKLVWCRLSASDEYQTPKSILEKLKLHTIDWAFSYIVSEKTDINKLIEIINFANDNDNFTHIRLVNDIINHNDNAFGYIKKNLDGLGINQSKLIYQETEEFKHGTKRCLSSLLTPVISPDGAMMPCCGITYATFPPALDWPKELSMGTDIEEIYKNQIYFNGSICKKCYQYARNDMLNMLWELKKINHKEFI